ncbi:MAG: hypothetical protein IKF82_00200 [Bacilli bacterium]|nr:hypothetical protein [Bacilli bacterium]
MNFECTLNMTGTDPKTSAKAFIHSYQDTSNIKYYKKYDERIQNFFQDKIEQNISQVQIHDNNLKQSFFVDFKNDGIYFNSNSNQALKYEYGYDQNPPKQYLESAVIETANEVSNIMITDALNLYDKYSRIL